MQTLAVSLPVKDLILSLSQVTSLDQDGDLQQQLQAVVANSHFKYSRLFGVGLFALFVLSDPELIKDDQQKGEALKAIAKGLHISEEKLIKDLELYSSNLEKMAQALIVMADIVTADRKKRDALKQA